MTIENETGVDALDTGVRDDDAPAPTRVDEADSLETPETPITEDPPATEDDLPVAAEHEAEAPAGAMDVAASDVGDAIASDVDDVVASDVDEASASGVDEAVASGVDDVVASDVDEVAASGVGDVVEDAPEPVTLEASSDEGDAGDSTPAPRSGSDRGLRPAITAPRDIGHVEDDLSADDFAEAVDRTVFEFREGDIVAGRVVRVDPDEVLVDIGYKSEGVIPSNELSIRNTANPSDVVAEGDEIEALVLQKEDESGRLVLSKKRAQYERAWGRIEQVMHDGGTVTGPVIEVVKGGLIVDIGLRGFLPASLVDLRRVRDLYPFVGETIEAKVIELDKNRNNVVLSRRAYLEEAQAEQRQAFLGDLQPGDVRDGVVSSVVNFGAFVDLGGMDGLVHVSELSWQHVSHPSEIVNVGDKVKVKVLEVDRDRERISLSIRQTREDPWDEFARDVEVGAVVDGEVTKTVPFGAFVSVSDGVEGLVHVSEIAIHHVPSPELELSIGQQVRVKVTEIDMERRRVSLSIKQALPEWEERSQWSDRGQQPPARETARPPRALPVGSSSARRRRRRPPRRSTPMRRWRRSCRSSRNAG